MRVGIKRGDLPGPLFMADLETVSQTDFPIEPSGQTRYISRPQVSVVNSLLTTVPPAIRSTGDITFPLAITLGVNDTLRLKVNAGAFVPVVIAASLGYADITALSTAVNAALTIAGVGVVAVPDGALRFILKNSTAVGTGVGTKITLDTNGNGSDANASLGFAAGGANYTVPTAAAVITALFPVGGALDVSIATILAQVSLALTGNRVAIKAFQDAIAPQFYETDVAIKSFEKGNLHGFLSATFSPDPHRVPAMALGTAIVVVQDDGVTPFVAPVPNISGAVHNVPAAGDITITGVGLANSEVDLTEVRVTHPSTGFSKLLYQKVIRTTKTGGTQGVVSATSIVIPASLLAGLGVANNTVQVQYTSLASNKFTTT